MPFIPIKPDRWPQDELRIPDGMGGMPPVERGNRTVVGSEFFALSARFQFATATPAQTFRREILSTPQDGDFWCDQIAVVSWEEEVGEPQDAQRFLQSMVTIRDVRTGKSLIFNRGLAEGFGAGLIPTDSVPVNLFRTLPQSGTEVGTDYDGTVPAPAGFRSKGSLIQPFCFTRQGGIEVTMTTLATVPANIAFDVNIGFLGWKEYANASR